MKRYCRESGSRSRNPARAFVALGAVLVLMSNSGFAAVTDKAQAGGNSDVHSPDKDVSALGSSDEVAKQQAQTRLMNGGSNAVPSLLNGLDGGNSEQKSRAAYVLRYILWKTRSLVSDPIAIAIAHKARTEPLWTSRDDMIATLRVMKCAAAVKELKSFAANDPSEYVRRDATHFISDVAQGDESPFYKAQVNDKSTLVRLAAYIELAKTGDVSGHAFALKTLKTSQNPGEREEALDVLGAIGDSGDSLMLKEISESGTDDARFKALHAYRKVQLHQLAPSDRLPALIKALDEESPEVRRWAYYELYHSADPNTNAALRKYISEPGHRGRKEAQDALNSR